MDCFVFFCIHGILVVVLLAGVIHPLILLKWKIVPIGMLLRFLFLGILWAFAVVQLARSGVISLTQKMHDVELISRSGVLRLGSVIWIALLFVGILITALTASAKVGKD